MYANLGLFFLGSTWGSSSQSLMEVLLESSVWRSGYLDIFREPGAAATCRMGGGRLTENSNIDFTSTLCGSRGSALLRLVLPLQESCWNEGKVCAKKKSLCPVHFISNLSFSERVNKFFNYFWLVFSHYHHSVRVNKGLILYCPRLVLAGVHTLCLESGKLHCNSASQTRE